MKSIRIKEHGGPEVLRPVDGPDPSAGEGELLVRLEAAGLNFIDVYHRTGLYPNTLPLTPGLEGAGIVQEVGEGATGFKKGDRVAWTTVLGSYAELVAVPADKAVPIPDGIETRTAAAVMLQGMTAHYLCNSTYPLKAGDSCLVHAAAGGVGLLLVQMAKAKGARVFGTVSTDEKAELARQAGVDEIILYTREDFLEVVQSRTEGRGVDVVYDAVGRDTADKSLDSLAPRGMMVFYGQSSGPVPPVDPLTLSQKGSLFLTRPVLFHHIPDRKSLESRSADVLGAVAAGALDVRVGQTFPLAEASQAHRALEGRTTTGKVLLLP